MRTARRTGRWPNARSGPIPEAPGETWNAINAALSLGKRGLPGGSSVRRLLAERRGSTDRVVPPRLTISQVLSWADAYHARHGHLPKLKSGVIPEAPGLTWKHIARALRRGEDDLPGGTTLRALMAEHDRARYRPARPSLTEERILAWADAHHARTGEWPNLRSGPIVEAPGESWAMVHRALKRGRRGLPGDSSLALLLHHRRGTRYCDARQSSAIDDPPGPLVGRRAPCPHRALADVGLRADPRGPRRELACGQRHPVHGGARAPRRLVAAQAPGPGAQGCRTRGVGRR